MTVFTVHLPPDTGDRLADAERAAFVPEAFSWAALIWGPLWLAANRAWLGLVAWLVLVAAATFAIGALQPSSGLAGLAALAVAVFFGFEGRELKRVSLEHRGYRLADVVSARNRGDAERLFFARWLDAPGAPAGRLPGAAPPPMPRSPVPGDIIGLFPQAGGRT